jgi:hypothetical protein
MIEMPEDADTRPLRFFAIIVGNEYAGPLAFPESEYMQGIFAALESSPTIIPVTAEQMSGVLPGWVWDGERFTAPEEL